MSALKILVVEDDRDAATLLRMTLESAGYAVTVLHDGAAALEWLALQTADMVISDWLMPYVDGWELQSRLAADPRHQHIPLLLISTLDTNRPKFEHAHRAFMVKPFAPPALLSLVQDMLTARMRSPAPSDQAVAPHSQAKRGAKEDE